MAIGLRELFDGFAAHYALAASQHASELSEFFGGFALADAGATIEWQRDGRAFEEFFRGYDGAVERWRTQEEGEANGFNLLEVLDLNRREIYHSRILAWLLDRDLTFHGTHAQGKLGFRLFLDEFSLPASYADGDYRVRLESTGVESRIDIEIAERGVFIVHIENKIGALEGAAQTAREWRDLQRRAAELRIPTVPAGQAVHALYLTREGSSPTNANFRPISWRQIANVFDRFAIEAKPPEVRLFSSHYANVLRKYILRKKEHSHGRGEV